MSNINIEFDGKIYSVDETTLAPLASPLERALIQQLAGTGALIRFGGTNYNVDANKLASARNVLTDHFSTGTITGTDSKVVVNGAEYGLSKTKLQNATDKMNEILDGMNEPVLEPSQGLEYQLNDDGVSYSVIGIGTCTDTDIVIPATHEGLPVTELKSRTELVENKGEMYEDTIGTFQACNNLISVTIPDSVTSIDSCAFEACKNLTNVTIPDSITNIGYNAFCECNNLTSITIPNGIMSIKRFTFGLCYSLTNIIIPDNVTSIDAYAFDNCYSLKSVTIGKSVISIGEWAFSGCSSLASINFNGTIDQWYKISKDLIWNQEVPATYVQCTDGQASL